MDSESQSPLDATELLAQLKGMQLPEAPIAADLGLMYLSLGICAVALIVFTVTHIKSRRTWHTTALRNLKDIQKQPAHNTLQQTAVLLKRITLTDADRKSVQHLNGERWLKYLDAFFSTDFFSAGSGQVFGSALYQPNATAEKNLYTELRRLIKRHKRNQP